MPTPTETAKAIVREWATWADRGMYIANGMIDRKALDRLEASIATSLVSAATDARATAYAASGSVALAQPITVTSGGGLSGSPTLTAGKPKAKRKPKGEAA